MVTLLLQSRTQDLAVAPIQALIHQGYTFKMVHSDMGSQYTSRLFETTLTDAHLRHSYSRKGKPAVLTTSFSNDSSNIKTVLPPLLNYSLVYYTRTAWRLGFII